MEEPRLSRERILTESRRLLEKEGLDSISLRRLAGRLRVQAPSLYWHFPDKAALLSALMEEIFCGVLDAVPDHRDWRKWMRAFGLLIWQSEHGARDFSRLMTTTGRSTEQLERIEERIRVRLRRLDLPEDDGMRLQASIQALVTGWLAFANSPYGDALGRIIDYDAQVLRDIDTLIAGEALRQQQRAKKRARRPSRPA